MLIITKSMPDLDRNDILRITHFNKQQIKTVNH